MGFIDRTGEENYNNYGTKMKIIEYNNTLDIVVEFQDEHKIKIRAKYNNFKKGEVRNPYDKTVYGVGYIGEGEYEIRENERATKTYEYWRDMIRRCYDPYVLNKYPAYIDCYVCEEWHCFQNFAKWYEENYYEVETEKMHLDKDVLIKGNKIYSPETCIFVPERINTLFTKANARRGEYPIGINYYKKSNKLAVHSNNGYKKIHLGYFPLNRPFQAFTVYKNFKENHIKQVADEYKDLIPKKLYEAMYKYEVEIND